MRYHPHNEFWNMLQFYLQKKRGRRSDNGSLSKPASYPSFVLVHNNDWNDYGIYSWFCLYYCESEDNIINIGELKLINENTPIVFEILKDGFNSPLDDSFCSLGISSDYYYRLREKIDPELRAEVLNYLRDCGSNKNIYEKFQNNQYFKESLFRDLSSREALEFAEFILKDDKPETAYSFTYTYHPDYDKSFSSDLNIAFDYKSKSYLRIAGIVGENGVGKTMLLRNMVNDLLATNPVGFNKIPHFHSCLVLHSSNRDSFYRGENVPRIKYRNFSYGVDYSFEDLRKSIDDILKLPLCFTESMAKIYISVLSDCIGQEFISPLFDIEDCETQNERYVLKEDYLDNLLHIFSSGQLQLFNLITFFVAEIHLSSLIIIDEPEVHMHASLIVKFMTVLGALLHKFKSFAIINTHSPLVIREIVQKNVYRMSVDEHKYPRINRVAFNTFGEDISELYYNIYGYNEEESLFTKIVKNMAKKKKDNGKDDNTAYTEIIKYLERDVILSLSSRMQIREAVDDIYSN